MRLGVGGGCVSSCICYSVLVLRCSGYCMSQVSSWSSNLRLTTLVLGQPLASPIDVRVLEIGCEDGLQLLQLLGVRLHLGVYICHHTLMVKCLCNYAVLKTEWMMRALGCDYILLPSKQQNNHLKCIQILR